MPPLNKGHPSNPKPETTFDTGPLAGKPVPDLLKRGNIDVNHRPGIKNDDGSVSSIFSVTIPLDKDGSVWKGKYEEAPAYALVPSIADGKFLTANGKIPPLANKDDSKLTPAQRREKQKQISQLEDAATDHYSKTRQHLGVFASDKAANDYATKTHAYMNDGTDRKVYTPSY